MGTRERTEDLRVALGAHNLTKSLKNDGRIIVKIAEIVIHPDWNPEIGNNAGDIAIVKLNDEDHRMFPHSNIRPICSPFGDDSEKISKYENGIYASWYKTDDENVEISDVPRQKSISIVERSECFNEFASIAEMAWPESFCAGKFADVRKGESGAGFTMKINHNFFLRGIIASGISDHDGKTAIVLMTDFLKYEEFIKKVSCWFSNF